MYKIIKVNGATFIFSPFRELETASLGVFLGVGSRFEEKGLKGIAHYLEHVLFKGSKKYSYRRIKREIEGRGGGLNAFTSHEMTGYYAQFLNKNLKITLDILLDMVINPRLKEEDIDKERNVILEEIKMYNDLPASRSGILLDRIIWPNHPLGEEVIGYDSTVKKIKRDNLVKFKEDFYCPRNMVIAFSGDFDETAIVELLREKISEGKELGLIEKKRPNYLRGLHIDMERKKLQQTHLCIGFRSVSYLSKQAVVSELINIILGANMSSRLFEALREKRSLCYDVSTEARKYKDSGAFVIHSGLDESRLEIAVETILNELRGLKEKEVSIKELNRAKDYLLGQIAMGIERPSGRMFFLAESFLSRGKIITLEDIKKKAQEVTPLRIREFAGNLFRFENMCISCVGDLKEELEQKIRKIVEKRI